MDQVIAAAVSYTHLLIGLTNIMGIQMLVPLGREKTVLYSEIVGVIVDVILNALLIPRFASAGAAIGTLAAEEMCIRDMRDAIIELIENPNLGERMSIEAEKVKRLLDEKVICKKWEALLFEENER